MMIVCNKRLNKLPDCRHNTGMDYILQLKTINLCIFFADFAVFAISSVFTRFCSRLNHTLCQNIPLDGYSFYNQAIAKNIVKKPSIMEFSGNMAIFDSFRVGCMKSIVSQDIVKPANPHFSPGIEKKGEIGG